MNFFRKKCTLMSAFMFFIEQIVRSQLSCFTAIDIICCYIQIVPSVAVNKDLYNPFHRKRATSGQKYRHL